MRPSLTSHTYKRNLAALIAIIAAASGAWFWSDYRAARFLPEDTSAFVASFDPPPAAGSPEERRELDELLALQGARTEADVAAARADRRKDAERFFGALGFASASTPSLPSLNALTDHVDDDVGRYVRGVKRRFLRHRPYVVEPRMTPCVTDVADDLSYPSGHAAFGYTMAYLLSDMVPERSEMLLERARQFANSRKVCGVHFESDLEAGRRAAEWLARELTVDADYQAAAAPARREVRMALGLRPLER